MVASACHAGAYQGRYVVVVDEDIELTGADEVLWAMTTRSNPVDSIEIIRRFWSSPVDPIIKKGDPAFCSRAIIDACRPYEWMDEFAPVNAFPAGDIEAVEKKWGKLLYE